MLIFSSLEDTRPGIFFGKMSNRKWLTIVGKEHRYIKKYLECDILYLNG